MLCEESGRRRQCRGPRGESGVNSIGLPSVRVCNQANPITSAYTPPPYNHRRSVPRSELSRARSGQPAGGCRPLVAERVTACALPFFYGPLVDTFSLWRSPSDSLASFAVGTGCEPPAILFTGIASWPLLYAGRMGWDWLEP